MNVVKVMRGQHGMVLGSGDLSTNTYRCGLIIPIDAYW